MSLFAYHWGEQALVYPHPVTGQPTGVKVIDLIKLGWKITDGGCRVTLPRFDAPQVQVEPASKMQAIDLLMRHGR